MKITRIETIPVWYEPTDEYHALFGSGKWNRMLIDATINLDYDPDPDFGRGPGPTVLYANGLRIGAQICYEGLFDWFSRDLANKGAQIIFNVTNDSWYGRFAEPFHDRRRAVVPHAGAGHTSQ